MIFSVKPTSKSKCGRDNIPLLLKVFRSNTYLRKATSKGSQVFGKEPIPKRIFQQI